MISCKFHIFRSFYIAIFHNSYFFTLKTHPFHCIECRIHVTRDPHVGIVSIPNTNYMQYLAVCSRVAYYVVAEVLALFFREVNY